jgi:hypothetical protein
MATLIDGKYVNMMFDYAANMQKSKLTVEEVTLARGIVLMFGGKDVYFIVNSYYSKILYSE